MKMTSYQYFVLTDAINKLENGYGVKVMKEHRENVKFTGNKFISFVWFIYSKIGIDDMEIIRENLNDDDIETALKKALVGYKFG